MMKMLDVYPVYDIEPEKGEGCYIFDSQGNRYLDLYGGHAVISIGHSHPHFIRRITDQSKKLIFYSNSVKIPLQEAYAKKLGELSSYENHGLFLCNSGAEAIENSLKVAAFNFTGDKIITFRNGFHGRTSMAVSCTDNKKIQTKFDRDSLVMRLNLNDIEGLTATIEEDVCAVIVEGIQGIGGIYESQKPFLVELRRLCDKHNTCLILDEVQSGFGRSGDFFAHQIAGIEADVVAMAKGMGNGFPVGGILARNGLEVWKGMLGSTFGGNHLACAAALGVLEVMEDESLVQNARLLGSYWLEELKKLPGVLEVRGRGLMIGLELAGPVSDLRKELLYKHHIFTGGSSNPNVIRLLPPLNITKEEVDVFTQVFTELLTSELVSPE